MIYLSLWSLSMWKATLKPWTSRPEIEFCYWTHFSVNTRRQVPSETWHLLEASWLVLEWLDVDKWYPMMALSFECLVHSTMSLLFPHTCWPGCPARKDDLHRESCWEIHVAHIRALKEETLAILERFLVFTLSVHSKVGMSSYKER